MENLKPIGKCEECQKLRKVKTGFQFCEAHRKSLEESRKQINRIFSKVKITL